MGFNAEKAGHATAIGMVRAMADREAEQIRAFVAFIESVNLATALRAHDWRTFALTYNGSGNVDAYAARIETAYRKITGDASPVVLRLGDVGEAVERLQLALGIVVDGSFGKVTQDAVRAFQTRHKLKPDGIVGAMTWTLLEVARAASPVMQPTTEDRIARVGQAVSVAGAAAGVVGTLAQALPPDSLKLLIGGAILLGVVALCLAAFRRGRGVV